MIPKNSGLSCKSSSSREFSSIVNYVQIKSRKLFISLSGIINHCHQPLLILNNPPLRYGAICKLSSVSLEIHCFHRKPFALWRIKGLKKSGVNQSIKTIFTKKLFLILAPKVLDKLLVIPKPSLLLNKANKYRPDAEK